MTSKTTRECLVESGLNQEAVDKSCRQLYDFSRKEKALRGTARPVGYMGSGNRNAEIMIVSDFPDESERNTKVIGCFADYAIVLTIMLNKLGINFEDAYWTTAIKDDTARINFDKIQQQRIYLQEEILHVDPSIIISLGTTPLTALLNKKTKFDSVSDDVGYNIHDNLPDIPIISLEHPSAYICTKDFQNKFSASWKKIKRAFE